MDRPQVGDQLQKRESPSRLAGGLTHAARLQDALSGLFAGGGDAQFRYDQAVDSLNRDPEPMMVAIAAAYGHCPATDYPAAISQYEPGVREAWLGANLGSCPDTEMIAMLRKQFPNEREASEILGQIIEST